MKFGYYADDELPKQQVSGYKVNGHGYRCPEFHPLPAGGKNVAVIGCSHTFGIGVQDNETWPMKLKALLSKNTLRFWNLGSPGASPEKCVRILYGSEKVIFPRMVIICWPSMSRRQRLDNYPFDLTGDNPLLKTENQFTDRHVFLKCVFEVEKFAEHKSISVFHCFAEHAEPLPNTKVLTDVTLKNCYPGWDKHGTRKIIREPDVASDNLHYGPKHHENFATKLYSKFGSKLK